LIDALPLRGGGNFVRFRGATYRLPNEQGQHGADEAWNRSDQDRAVLILDCWNPHLSDHERAMICRMFSIADEQKKA